MFTYVITNNNNNNNIIIIMGIYKHHDQDKSHLRLRPVMINEEAQNV